MASSSLVSTDSVWLLSGQVLDGEPVREIPINVSPFQVGRRSDLSFSIPSPTVSNLHAEIVERRGILLVRDLASTNGTFVNGRRVDVEEPLHEGDLVQFANVVFRLKRQDTVSGVATVHGTNCDRAMALIQFDRLMSERAVVPFFQPIVRTDDRSTIAYEVLGRSHLFGLKTPNVMFQAASQLNLEAELSRLCRWVGMDAGKGLSGSPHLFLNTHPVELVELEVLELSLQELREVHPHNAITLEIHESAVTDPSMMRSFRTMLNDLNIGLAYDDFGAGQARLLELVEVPPNYLKFDIMMIKDIDIASSQRQHMLGSLVRMVNELGISALAEGIETKGEAEMCADLGFELNQGFYYGRPAPVGVLRQPK